MAQVQSFNKVQLRKNIDATFSLRELDTLLFDLGIDSGHIAGADKVEKVINLIGYCQRRGSLLDLIAALEENRPRIQWRQEVIPQPTSLETVEARSQHRSQLYKQAEGLQLVHTILPSRKRENYWDILIYVIRHKSNDLSFVKQAEFFLGRYWGNEIFTVPNQDDFMGITISAFGPALCTCRVIYLDEKGEEKELMLQRYLDFEMTSLYLQDKPEIMIDPSTLAERMRQNFDLSEIEMLASDFGMNIGELSGMSNEARAAALIQYSQGYKRLPELLKRLETERPHVQWRE